MSNDPAILPDIFFVAEGDTDIGKRLFWRVSRKRVEAVDCLFKLEVVAEPISFDDIQVGTLFVVTNADRRPPLRVFEHLLHADSAPQSERGRRWVVAHKLPLRMDHLLGDIHQHADHLSIPLN